MGNNSPQVPVILMLFSMSAFAAGMIAFNKPSSNTNTSVRASAEQITSTSKNIPKNTQNTVDHNTNVIQMVAYNIFATPTPVPSPLPTPTSIVPTPTDVSLNEVVISVVPVPSSLGNNAVVIYNITVQKPVGSPIAVADYTPSNAQFITATPQYQTTNSGFFYWDLTALQPVSTTSTTQTYSLSVTLQPFNKTDPLVNKVIARYLQDIKSQ